MSAIAIDISELDIPVKELLARLQRNQEIIITASNQPVAKLTAISAPAVAEADPTSECRQSGLTQGAAWMSPDFNEPLADFAEYMP